MCSTDLEQALIFFGCLVVAVILHEMSHGVVARWFGDDTASEAGRLTLNPIPHIDPFGSIDPPRDGRARRAPGDRLGEAGAGQPVAHARPAPRHALREPGRSGDELRAHGRRRRSPRGRSSTLHRRPSSSSTDLPLASRILFSFALVNLFLGLFNLLPIPPLDGSALIERVLPEAVAARLVPVPAVRDARAVPARVLTGFVGRILDPFYDQLFGFVFG